MEATPPPPPATLQDSSPLCANASVCQCCLLQVMPAGCLQPSVDTQASTALTCHHSTQEHSCGAAQVLQTARVHSMAHPLSLPAQGSSHSCPCHNNPRRPPPTHPPHAAAAVQGPPLLPKPKSQLLQLLLAAASVLSQRQLSPSSAQLPLSGSSRSRSWHQPGRPPCCC